MPHQSGGSFNVYIHLDQDDRFVFHTPTGPIEVQRLRGSDYNLKRGKVQVTGPAIKKDGTHAFFYREGLIKMDDLSVNIRSQLRFAMIEVAEQIDLVRRTVPIIDKTGQEHTHG